MNLMGLSENAGFNIFNPPEVVGIFMEMMIKLGIGRWPIYGSRKAPHDLAMGGFKIDRIGMVKMSRIIDIP